MNKLKLLIIDDEIDFAMFVADVADDMGFEVISAHDPKEFANLYSEDISIIILDLFMPGIDGIEILRHLVEYNSSASIIFMSGKDSSVLQSAQKIAEQQGVNVLGLLSKPFLAEQLENVLGKYVSRAPIKEARTFVRPSANEIRTAIEKKELHVVYQPQIRIADRTVIGVEALVRWNHPLRGMIPPDIFVPIAEENELVGEITSFVTNTSIQQQADWLKAGTDLRMSINISPKILDDLDMPEKLAACAIDVGANIQNIVFEVTETALMSDVVRYMDILTRLRMKGFSLSIDDFGTGYSSLQQLVRVPFNELKIDRSFINKINSDKEFKAISEISILLAHKLGMTVVAEGIEDESVWETLKELGCDEGQGYWMAKPMLADEIETWMEHWYSI